MVHPGTLLPGLTIFAGRFGSGKTEVAINYALAMAETLHRSNAVVLVDLDIVTPYFRTRETAEAIVSRGVEVVAPSAVGRYLDVPAISPQILGAIEQTERPVVVDVGGDPQGARALGQYSSTIHRLPHALLFVVNPYRPFTQSADELARSIAEIEGPSRLKVTSLVSNPNLMGESTAEIILDGHAQIERMAEAIGLSVTLVCLEQHWAAELASEHFAQPVLVLDRHFVMVWE